MELIITNRSRAYPNGQTKWSFADEESWVEFVLYGRRCLKVKIKSMFGFEGIKWKNEILMNYLICGNTDKVFLCNRIRVSKGTFITWIGHVARNYSGFCDLWEILFFYILFIPVIRQHDVVVRLKMRHGGWISAGCVRFPNSLRSVAVERHLFIFFFAVF